MPMLMVASDAVWTLNAFAGGYARQLSKGGVLGRVRRGEASIAP
jgi:hypothetical protein